MITGYSEVPKLFRNLLTAGAGRPTLAIELGHAQAVRGRWASMRR
jgi:hypothetical protein